MFLMISCRIGGRLYDILAFEAGLHAFSRSPMDWFTLSYYLLDAIISRADAFWDQVDRLAAILFGPRTQESTLLRSSGDRRRRFSEPKEIAPEMNQIV